MHRVSAMIKVFIGQNSYEIFQAIKNEAREYDNSYYERYDGEDIDSNKMAEICSGMSLFSTKKMVVVDELSKNKNIWDNLETWLDRLDFDTLLILVEPALDKRTKAYKLLDNITDIASFDLLDTRRDTQKVEKWLQAESKKRSITIDKNAIRELIVRIGVDQWLLSNELNRLSVMGDVTLDTVQKYTEPSPIENVFALLDTAINSDVTSLRRMIRTLKSTNDPYMTFGLLSSQFLSICALILSRGKSTQAVARDIGQNEYAVSRLRPLGRKFDDKKLEKVIKNLAETDKAIKSTDDPWHAIEKFLITMHDELA